VILSSVLAVARDMTMPIRQHLMPACLLNRGTISPTRIPQDDMLQFHGRLSDYRRLDPLASTGNICPMGQFLG